MFRQIDAGQLPVLAKTPAGPGCGTGSNFSIKLVGRFKDQAFDMSAAEFLSHGGGHQQTAGSDPGVDRD